MQCPNDQATLLMTDRQGIEIDYCPTCRGVWLDKGELDKLIANSESNSAPMQQQAPQQYSSPAPQQRYNDDHKYQNDHSQSYGNDHYKKKKKESFLGDLFDF